MAEELSVLGEQLSITGRITGEGDLEIRGRLDGEVDLRGDLTLAETAIVKATLVGARVTVRGALLGDVLATEAIVLDASARVVGNLKAPRIAVALGAQIRGELDMGEVAPGERPKAQAAAKPAARPAAAPRPAPAARPAAVVARPAPPPRSNPAAAALHAPSGIRMPPEPVVPAIKKGAKATKKKA
jgi:cytoskeletal protein CcmA (bactofilin family)